jgi:hypothetical protein
MLRNKHFWITLIIIALISYIYYDWYNRFEWFWWYSVYEGLNHATGTLFLFAFLYASIMFRFRGALISWVIAFALALPRIIFFAYDINDLVSNIILAFVPLMAVGIITLELNWRNRQGRMIEQREQERQAFMAQICTKMVRIQQKSTNVRLG